MTEDFKNDSLWFMKGDCLERMKEIPDGSVDMILTDPPYGINFQSQRKRDKSKWLPKIANDKAPFVTWMEDAFRKLKVGGCAIVFCRWDVWFDFQAEAERVGFKVKEQIVWDKMNHGTGDLRGAPGSRHEVALFMVKGRFLFHGKRQQTLVQHKKVAPSKIKHPNEKPVSLMTDLINGYCVPRGTVLDPFTGVSPVGVACANTDRNFIGIELDPDYYDIGTERVLEALRGKK